MSIKNKLLKTAYNSPDNKSLQSTIQYFDTISGKNLKLPFIRQKLFKTSWNGSEISTIARCHLQAAVIYLNHLSSIKQLADFIEELKMVIAEAIPYVNELDSEQDTSFILMSTNTLPSFAHHLNAQELFYNHNIRIDYRDNYSCDVLVLYALRLTLEKRIYGIIGIDYILNKNNKPIPLSKIIGLIKNLKNIEFSSSLKWEEIEGLNKWLNHFMHRNLRPHPWIIHQAFETFNELLGIKPYKYGERKISSWYSTTVVKNKPEFEEEIEDTIKTEFPGCKITWLNNYELLILK